MAKLTRRSVLVAAGVAVASGREVTAAPKFALAGAKRILFLGDSITAAGLYVQYVEAYLLTRFPEKRYEVFSLGLPSEGVTGLSEPDHPWPRPNVHERLGRALERIKPDTVIACYGMNDGMYYPFSRDRFRQYQEGIRRLIAAGEAAGARVIHLTPPAFDPRPLGPRALGIGAPKYSWVTPYARYDQDVLAQYSEWLLTLRTEGRLVADAHAATSGYLARTRDTEPAFILAGDGVHMDNTGEWLMAQALLVAINAPAVVDEARIESRTLRVRKGDVSGLKRKGTGLELDWTTRIPLPYDPAWHAPLVARERLTERLNWHRLTITGLPAGSYELREGGGAPFGSATAAELAAGVDLLRYAALSTNRRAAALLPLVRERERLLWGAWLTAVGHKRPDTAVGVPLAEALPRAEALEARFRELAKPASVALSIRAAG